MPLIESASRDAANRNIEYLILEGKEPQQAEAIAYAIARKHGARWAKRKDGKRRGRKMKNPRHVYTTGNGKETDWIPVHAIRQYSDGSIQMLTEKGVMSNPGRRKKFLKRIGKMFGGVAKALKNPRDKAKYQVVIEGFSNNYASSLAKAKAKIKSLATTNHLNGAFFEILRGSTIMYSGRVWKDGTLTYF